MLAEIGCDLDDALEEVRSLAQGVYPALLATYGLVEALRSAARRSPAPVTVRGEVARYPADTEAAVYFCCLETLQNVAKHAGRDATATVRLWEDGPTLRFQTRDSGVGFTPNGTPRGRGLVNMRDRLAAVGGSLDAELSGRGRNCRQGVRSTCLARCALIHFGRCVIRIDQTKRQWSASRRCGRRPAPRARSR